MRVSRWMAGCLAMLLLSSVPARSQEPDFVRTAQGDLDRGAYKDAIASLNGPGTGPDQLTPAVRLRVAIIRSGALLGQADFDQALGVAREAVRLSSGLGPDVVADALFAEARAAMQRADRSEQTSVLEQALSAAAAAEGPDGLRTLRVRDRIALLLSANGRAAEAEGECRKILEQANRISNEPTRDSLRFLNTLGVALLRQSKFAPAREAFQTAFDGRVKLLSAAHPDTLESEHNLGVALRRLGLGQQADAVFADTVRLRTQTLGADHPDTLITRTMIVRQLIDQSQFEAAVTESTAVYAALLGRLGERDVRTIEAMGDMATALFRSGRMTEGVRAYRRAFELANQTLGETNPEAMNVGHEYAGLLYQSGQLAEALGIFQRVLRSTRKIFDDENRDTIATLHSIALVLSDLGRVDEAIEALQYVAGILDRQVEKAHPNRLSVLNNLAIALHSAHRDGEALPIIQEVVALRTSLLGPKGSLTLLSLGNEAAVLASLGRFDEAIAIHRQNLAARLEKYGERHPETLKSLHNLASTLDQANLKAEAEPLYRKVVEARVEVLGPRNIETVTSMRGLAGLLAETGRRDEAIPSSVRSRGLRLQERPHYDFRMRNGCWRLDFWRGSSRHSIRLVRRRQRKHHSHPLADLRRQHVGIHGPAIPEAEGRFLSRHRARRDEAGVSQWGCGRRAEVSRLLGALRALWRCPVRRTFSKDYRIKTKIRQSGQRGVLLIGDRKFARRSLDFVGRGASIFAQARFEESNRAGREGGSRLR
jgi:tetratricopeptide (TPR) repeat protein